MVRPGRLLRHLLTTRGQLRRRFPRATLAAIEQAIRAAETRHAGEIRFAIETRLGLGALCAATDPRTRAREVFGALGVWDTAANNGVLIYLLFADRDIEIVADRGFHARIADADWEAVCRSMEAEFRAGRFEAGALAGIERVSALIARHFPRADGDRNELPDAPALLR